MDEVTSVPGWASDLLQRVTRIETKVDVINGTPAQALETARVAQDKGQDLEKALTTFIGETEKRFDAVDKRFDKWEKVRDGALKVVGGVVLTAATIWLLSGGLRSFLP